MLVIHVPEFSTFNEEDCTFDTCKATDLVLEHSLLSISKWEAKWHKPFLADIPKESHEIMDYIKCMTINNVPDMIYYALTDEQYKTIKAYMENPMTATTIPKEKGSNREIITSELLYYYMIANNIPIECQKWHINRLMILLGIFNVKNSKPKKKSQREILRDNAALNAARKKKLNTKG